MPGYLVSLTWVLLLLPFALGWFLIRLHHGSTATSVTMIVLLMTPGAYLQVKELVTHYGLFDDFSKKAFYSTALYPWDRRLAKTLSIDEFSHLLDSNLPSDSDARSK